jgi:hypothetical protein
MMGNFLLGFVIGGVLFFCSAKVDSHRNAVKLRVQQEQRYVKLQGHVDEAVKEIEGIINGSK